MQNLTKTDGAWKRIQATNRRRKFANRTAAIRATPKRGFDSRRAYR